MPLRARLTVGYVLGPAAAGDRPLRPLIAVLRDIPSLPDDLVALAGWMSDRYLCSVGEAVGAMLPPGLMKHARLTISLEPELNVSRRIRSLESRGVAVEHLHRTFGPGAATLLSRWLADRTARISVVLPPVAPSRAAPARRRPRVHPTLWRPSRNGRRGVLLLGGEREGTYVAAIEETLRRGRQVLALFASVTAAERFAARVHDVLRVDVTTLHADLPESERLGRWLAVRQGGAAVVAGTRAAVFSPLDRLGLVLVDEENDVGHREERVPRYHVRDIARQRAERFEATLLLADDVLSTETYAAAGQPGIEVLRPRAAARGGPRVVIVDLRRRDQPPEADVLSGPLVAALRRVLREGGRALLFVHRKGYAGLLVCADCGYSPLCPRCEVPLAYDARDQTLRCRYCRDAFPPPSVCPRCGGRVFSVRGTGTQRVVRLARALRAGPVLRLDSDVARTPAAVAGIVRQFRDQGGILVATPLVLEAPEPPRVDLAGIVLADASLRYPDFRAPEQGLRTLWRIRGLARTWCLVQTYTPDHPALIALRRGELRSFYREELRVRRAFHYPPNGEVLAVEVTGREPSAGETAASLATAAGEGVEVLGPAQLRRGPQSRWQVVFRGVGALPREGLSSRLRHLPSGVRAAVDVNP